MNTRASTAVQHMKPETVESLQDLVRGLRDSQQYLHEAADRIKDDDMVANTLRSISTERQQICDNIAAIITVANEQPARDGTFTGSLRKIWTAFRAGLNAGDPKIVLIEAERAEDVIVNKFKTILPEIADTPVNKQLYNYFGVVKDGHDRVLALRNAYQNK